MLVRLGPPPPTSHWTSPCPRGQCLRRDRPPGEQRRERLPGAGGFGCVAGLGAGRRRCRESAAEEAENGAHSGDQAESLLLLRRWGGGSGRGLRRGRGLAWKRGGGAEAASEEVSGASRRRRCGKSGAVQVRSRWKSPAEPLRGSGQWVPQPRPRPPARAQQASTRDSHCLPPALQGSTPCATPHGPQPWPRWTLPPDMRPFEGP